MYVLTRVDHDAALCRLFEGLHPREGDVSNSRRGVEVVLGNAGICSSALVTDADTVEETYFMYPHSNPFPHGVTTMSPGPPPGIAEKGSR
jgi:hypothetical protein